MLDQVLISQALLSGLTLIINLSLFSCIFLALWLILKFSLPKRKFLRRCCFALGLLPILLMCSGFLYSRFRAQAKISVNLDLSKSLALADAYKLENCVASTLVKGQYDCISEGFVDFSLILKNDFRLNQRARLVWASGTKDKIERLLFFTQPLSLAEVKILSEKLISNFAIPRERYDQWLQTAAAGNISELKYLSTKQSDLAAETLEFSILPVQNSADKNCFINATFRWK